MESAEINPFDLSKSKQEARFEELCEDPNFVNSSVAWYVRNHKLVIKNELSTRELGGTPLASTQLFGRTFPGNLTKHDFGMHFDKELGQKIANIINNNPFVCLNAPNIPLSFTEEGSDSANKKRTYKQEEREIRDRLGLTPQEISSAKLANVSHAMGEAEKELIEALYFRYVLDQAASSIIQIAPSLEGLVKDVIEATVLVKSVKSEKESDLEGQPDLKYQKIAGLHIITVQKDPYTDFFDHNHGFRVSGMGHELTHALIHSLLDLPENSSHIPEANLDKVIAEGVALAYEYEFFSKAQTKSGDKILLTRLDSAISKRPQIVKTTNRYLSPTYRKKQGMDPEIEFYPEDFADLNYSEGTKIAIALKRNGWSLNNLQGLLHKVSGIVAEVTEKEGGEIFRQIGVSTEEDSQYQKILKKIRELKPDK